MSASWPLHEEREQRHTVDVRFTVKSHAQILRRRARNFKEIRLIVTKFPFLSSSPSLPPPLLLLRYSIICWLEVSDCCFGVRDICHRPGPDMWGPSWALRREAAIWEARAHRQSLSLGSDHLAPPHHRHLLPQQDSTIFNRLNVCSPPPRIISISLSSLCSCYSFSHTRL